MTRKANIVLHSIFLLFNAASLYYLHIHIPWSMSLFIGIGCIFSILCLSIHVSDIWREQNVSTKLKEFVSSIKI